MKRVLVTGATGFVGANLARRLLSDGHQVHLLVRPGYTAWRIDDIRTEVVLHLVDLGDRDALQRTIDRVRPDWIFHLAAYGAYSSQTDLPRMVRANVSGTMNLVEACLRPGFEAFVNTGSSSEYGFQAHAPSEQQTLEPNSHYAVTKAAASLFCRHTAQSHRVHLPTLRLYSVYGPYEEPTRLLPALVVRGTEDQLPPLVNPAIARDFVYVDDVVDAYFLAATTPTAEAGAIYNVGTGTQTTLQALVTVVRRVMAIAAEPTWGSMPDRGWDTTVWVADSSKIRHELGWAPRYTVEQGVRAMLAWFHQEPGRIEWYRERIAAAG